MGGGVEGGRERFGESGRDGLFVGDFHYHLVQTFLSRSLALCGVDKRNTLSTGIISTF